MRIIDFHFIAFGYIIALGVTVLKKVVKVVLSCIIFFAFSLSVGLSPATSVPKIILTTSALDSTSTDIRWAPNIYVYFYNANLPVSDSKSRLIVSNKFPLKYIGASIKKNDDVRFIIAGDGRKEIGENGKYQSKVIFIDDRIPNQQNGGIIETFETFEDAKAYIPELKKEIGSDYVYQNGVDLLAVSSRLSKKQIEKYKNCFLQLRILNDLSDAKSSNL